MGHPARPDIKNAVDMNDTGVFILGEESSDVNFSKFNRKRKAWHQ